MGAYNPIRSVTPVDADGVATGSTVTELPTPSEYRPKLMDVSAPGAGNTEDGTMQKKRIGQKVRLDLKWKAVSLAIGAAILQAFNSEYLAVEYLDAKAGGWITKTFYVGDRDAPLYNSTLGIWDSIAFPIIQRNMDPG